MGGILEPPCFTLGEDRDSMPRSQLPHHELIHQADGYRAADPALQDGAGLSQYSCPPGMIRTRCIGRGFQNLPRASITEAKEEKAQKRRKRKNTKRELVVGYAIACWVGNGTRLTAWLPNLRLCTYMDYSFGSGLLTLVFRGDSLCRCLFVRLRFVNLICCIFVKKRIQT